ncbi:MULTISPECIES: alpha-amylase family glycosyl hydrolase [unclassified Lentimicrobium]|uniref:alpha-amylase family glycosyl hydrolase n=1 Tax=unclassified Lentimicrobium TaxID=2677434 RepID=UPI001554441B|nr:MULTISPECIES: alpha-amylase family glycosyl hydrolase [unclassified Lentimicrobium]NPD45984.1 alpha-amylase [Lentimicrobium sp. S6]NPD84249.1 alpha-amylase [Lentimicrobium sp. L6]
MKKKILSLIGVFGLLIFMSCNNSTNEKMKLDPDLLPVSWSKNANIYEVNIRQYTEEGTFNAFAKELPRLKKMGVDILWIMPIHPIGEKNRKGSLGSYYSIKDYKAVNPEFGDFQDFKNLVDKAHQQGMHVIIDWVANHTAWDHHWMKSNPEYYELNEQGEMFAPYDWSDVVSLEYNNKEMRAEMIDALKYWVREADIDGYRCDVASEVPTDFWNEVRTELDKIKPVFMLAESEESDLLEYAFDMNYGWEFHHLMNSIAKGEKGKKELLEYIDKEKENTPQRAYKMYFITNHDENSWNGTIEERLGSAQDALAVLTFTLGDMPLIYSGQESSNAKRLDFFEKDLIDWGSYPKSRLYKNLISIKHDNPALWNGEFGGEFKHIDTKNKNVFCFTREKDGREVLVIINLSTRTFENEDLGVDFSKYGVLLTNKVRENNDANLLSLKPWGYTILAR